jgi:hypothetical protein
MTLSSNVWKSIGWHSSIVWHESSDKSINSFDGPEATLDLAAIEAFPFVPFVCLLVKGKVSFT